MREEGVQIKAPPTPPVEDPAPTAKVAQAPVPNENQAARARRMLGDIHQDMSATMVDLESSEPTTRVAIVAAFARRVQGAIDDVVQVTAQVSPRDRASLQAVANKSATSALLVATWINSRTPNTKMKRAIAPVRAGLDRAFSQLGVETIGERTVPALKDREVNEADSERSRAVAEASYLRNTISAELDLRAIANEARRAEMH